MRVDDGTIAAAFLRYSRRVGVGLLKVDPDKPLPDVVGEFFDDFSSRRAMLRIDDVQSLIRGFFRRHPDFVSWYAAVLKTNGIRIDFADSEPRIPREAFAQWRRVTWHTERDWIIEPDCLIAFQYVDQFQHQWMGRLTDPSHLVRWATVARVADPMIDRVMDDGAVDIHTHLGGCRSVPALWKGILDGRVAPQSLELYRLGYQLETLKSADLRNQAVQERLAIADAIDAAHFLFASPGRSTGPMDTELSARMSASDRSRFYPSSLAREIWAERQMMIDAWDQIMQRSDGPGECSLQLNEKNKATASALDVYLFGKHRFFSSHVQSPQCNPGLSNFRRFFDRPVQSLGPVRGAAWVRRRDRIKNTDCAALACESAILKALEIRISPSRNLVEYKRFFQDWRSHIEPHLHQYPPPVEIDFVVHFIREPDKEPEPGGEEDWHRGSLRTRIDMETAALHVFRLEYPGLADRVVGVDVANLERGCPPGVFAPYLKLLRGQLEEKDVAEARFMNRWQHLASNRRFRMPPSTARLGLTYHVGEDFFHVADGLYTLWTAITQLEMRSGDRLGHALALGVDVGWFNDRYGASTMMPAGLALDVLAWLRMKSVEFPGSTGRLIHKLDQDLQIWSHELHGEPVGLELLSQVLLRRYRPIPADFRRSQSQLNRKADLLYRRELMDPELRRKRRKLIATPRSIMEAQDLLTDIQAQLVEEVVERDLVIEINPSSNLAIGDMDDLRKHPALRLIQQQADIRMAINCDDPGTFHTRIENEFAAMADALGRRHGRSTDGKIGEPLTEKFLKSCVENGRLGRFRVASRTAYRPSHGLGR